MILTKVAQVVVYVRGLINNVHTRRSFEKESAQEQEVKGHMTLLVAKEKNGLNRHLLNSLDQILSNLGLKDAIHEVAQKEFR